AAIGLACDVTDAGSVRAAFDAVCARFGGVDIVVSNAGAAWQGRIGEVEDEVLRQSFELNFFAHQTVAQNAVRIMLAQGTGGCLLFNVSKQAINPGPLAGPYGLPKAATLFLVRQYALEYGADGIRANAVNADGIRGGLLTPPFVEHRAVSPFSKARDRQARRAGLERTPPGIGAGRLADDAPVETFIARPLQAIDEVDHRARRRVEERNVGRVEPAAGERSHRQR